MLAEQRQAAALLAEIKTRKRAISQQREAMRRAKAQLAALERACAVRGIRLIHTGGGRGTHGREETREAAQNRTREARSA